MVYSDSSTSQGIVEEARFLVNATSANYPINDLTRSINRGLDRVAYLIQTADGRWQWDDSNQTDLPIATTNIVSGQTDYTFDATHLKIIKVLVKDTNGDWKILQPVDTRDVETADLIKASSSNVGVPERYDKLGSSIFLDPQPNYNSTSGLKVFFQRNTTYFTPSDTTKQPGFNPQFHRLLSLYAARDFCSAKGLPQLAIISQQILQLEESLVDFYSNRNSDEQKSIRTVYSYNSFK